MFEKKLNFNKLFIFIPLLCACAGTISRSPDIIQEKEFAIGATYTTYHQITGPEHVNNSTDNVDSDHSKSPVLFATLGLNKNWEISGSGFYSMSSLGLFVQSKYQYFRSKNWKFTIIGDAFTLSSNSSGPDQNTVLPDYLRTFQASHVLSVAPSFGYVIDPQKSLFFGPEVLFLAASSKYEKSVSDNFEKKFNGVLYGAFVGYSMYVTSIFGGHVNGEVTIRGLSAPENVISQNRQFYVDGFLSFKFVFADYNEYHHDSGLLE